MRTLSVCLYIILFLNMVSYAQKTFTPTSGAWNTLGNWSPVGAQSPTDDVFINSGSTLTVDVDATCAFTPSTGAFEYNSGSAQHAHGASLDSSTDVNFFFNKI
jgi:hypothetical protein